MAQTYFHAYVIQCITNLHAGSGDATYGVVDKLVQRDPVTNFPTIHASSLKGALREHFEKEWVKKKGLTEEQQKQEQKKINTIFGKEAKGAEEESESGEYRFLSADLLALPVRCNYRQFALTVSHQVIELLNTKSKLLVGKEIFDKPAEGKFYSNQPPGYDVYLEDDKTDVQGHKPLFKVSGIDKFDKQYAVAKSDLFDAYIRDLPVIARNQLNNGISKNLWYEEVVPHQTLFITYIAATTATKNHFDEFEKELLQPLQIGGNASVGYGVCQFHKIEIKS